MRFKRHRPPDPSVVFSGVLVTSICFRLFDTSNFISNRYTTNNSIERLTQSGHAIFSMSDTAKMPRIRPSPARAHHRRNARTNVMHSLEGACHDPSMNVRMSMSTYPTERAIQLQREPRDDIRRGGKPGVSKVRPGAAHACELAGFPINWATAGPARPPFHAFSRKIALWSPPRSPR